MKKIVIVLAAVLLLAMLSGCGALSSGDEAPAANTDPGQEQSMSPEEIIKAFEAMLTENKKPFELLAFIDEHISGLDKEQASKLVGDALQKAEAAEYDYNEAFFNDNRQELMLKYFNEGFDPEKVKFVQEEDLKSFLNELTTGSYKIMSVEGNFMAIVDYEAMKKYNDKITDELKDYISIMAENSNQPTAMDAGVLISWDELLDRILMTEDYLSKYKESNRREMQKQILSGYIMVYLSGMDNTPVFDYSTNLLMDKMKSHFENTGSKYASKVIGKITKEYLELLTQENFEYTEAVQSYLMGISEKIDQMYP